MKPYYSEPNITIYNGDCLEVMGDRNYFPNHCANLCLTDIPFNVSLKYEDYKDNLDFGEYKKQCYGWFELMKNKCLKTIIKVPTKNLNIVMEPFDNVLGYDWMIIQHSPNATTHGRFNLSLYTVYLVGVGETSKRPNKDFFINTKNKLHSKHPAEMPVNPMHILIDWFTNPGDTIIDPFLGSGTTARACKDLGRKCIGIEISQKYCDIAIKRLGQEVLF